MRSLPGILLTALTVVLIAVSAFLTASHFGMRDWPTPPMPDTATRLITPTEAASKARERLSKGDDPVEVKVAGDAGADARRNDRRVRGGESPSTDRGRRGSSRRGDRSGRRSGDRRSGNRHSGGRSDGGDRNPSAPADDDATTPAPAQPAAPESAPPAPVTEASSGEQSQARPDQPVTPPAVPAPSLDPVIPDLPSGSDDPGDAPSGGDGQGDRPGHGHGRRRGAVRNLLDALL